MIQCGDPTGTGRGGESVYGGKFEDEITKNLKHVGAGIVSMANRWVLYILQCILNAGFLSLNNIEKHTNTSLADQIQMVHNSS